MAFYLSILFAGGLALVGVAWWRRSARRFGSGRTRERLIFVRSRKRF